MERSEAGIHSIGTALDRSSRITILPVADGPEAAVSSGRGMKIRSSDNPCATPNPLSIFTAI